MRRRRSRGATLGLAVLCLGAVSCRFAVADLDQAVAAPSFAQDILPIFEDHCVLCHGSPSNHGAPTYFRLDSFDDSVVDGQPLLGAATMIGQAVRRINEGTMPPAAKWGDGLGDNAKKTVQAWAANPRR